MTEYIYTVSISSLQKTLKGINDATPRKEQISLTDTPYYHVVSRCVRRAYLCGKDKSSGKCYEHRRGLIENRIRLLSSLFGIEINAYSIMSNHYHIVAFINPHEIDELTDRAVVDRWLCLFSGPTLVQRWYKGDSLCKAELDSVYDCINVYRGRLKDLSWFMRCLNENIARQANKEDQCTGHFWESRFKSQALLTEEALLSCMAYVDLNPIRACMADTPEESDYTSIKERITPTFKLSNAIKEQIKIGAIRQFNQCIKPLAAFEGNLTNKQQSGILFSEKDYLELVDYTGRIVREDKRGYIPDHLPSILTRLEIQPDDWLASATQFERLSRKKPIPSHKMAQTV